MSETVVEFFIPGMPRGKQTPVAARFGNQVRVLKAKKTRRYEDMISHIASIAMAGRAPLDEAVGVSIRAVITVPVSWSRPKRAMAFAGLIYPTGRPDCSNILKSCEDGCIGIIFRDDALVVDASASKVYGERPGVLVTVWRATQAAPVAVQGELEVA